jgi:hypothetical protein
MILPPPLDLLENIFSALIGFLKKVVAIVLERPILHAVSLLDLFHLSKSKIACFYEEVILITRGSFYVQKQ